MTVKEGGKPQLWVKYWENFKDKRTQKQCYFVIALALYGTSEE